MKIFVAALICIFGNAYWAYSAQDSSVSARKAALNARQSAMSKSAAQQQNTTVQQSPSPAVAVPKTDATAATAATTAQQPSVPKLSNPSSDAKDSTVKTGANAIAPAAAKPESAPQVKIAAPEKKAGVEEEDLLIDETEEKKNPAKQSVDNNQIAAPGQADTVAPGQKNADATKDSLKTQTPASPQQTPVAAQAPGTVDTTAGKILPESEKPVQPATVEAVHSINFAKNLKDYRSPKLAMLLSLLVPGLGQAYVKSYYKTGVFVALEATAIGFSVAYNNKGKKQLDNAQSFADQNYNNDNLTTYYKDLFGFISGKNGSGPIGDSVARDKLSSIYLDTSFLKGSTYRSQGHYSNIQENSYVQGWNDCEPKGSKIFTSGQTIFSEGQNTYKLDDSTGYKVYKVGKNGSIDSTMPLYGYSTSQEHFKAMVSQSNSYYKTAQGILFTLLVNHIISAVDALISAKAYNEALLGRESMWQHISLQQQLVDAGPSLSAGMAMRIQF